MTYHPTDQLIAVISKPSSHREEADIEAFLPWLRRRVAILRDINTRELLDIVKYCQYQTCSHDDVIIQQGDLGDRMYVLLRGSSLVYIDPQLTGEDDTPLARVGRGRKSTDEVKPGGGERSKFGKFIMKYDAGESFGEAALLTEEKIRNATILADEECELMVIDQALFDKALKSHEEQVQGEITKFIDTHVVFARMSSKFKRLLQLSLRKVAHPRDSLVCRQGTPATALFFLLGGQANISMEPGQYSKQYPHLAKDLLSIQQNLQRSNPGLQKPSLDRRVYLCCVQAGEVIGDVEVVHALGTYASTVTCTEDTVTYRLDAKNLERILGRRNPSVMEVMRQKVKEKLEARAATHLGREVILLTCLLSRNTDARPSSSKTITSLPISKVLPSRDVQIRHLLEKFRNGEAQLIEPRVPGALIYKEQMQDRARIRANVRKRETLRSMVNETRRKMTRRQPRSRRAIMATLTQLIESRMASSLHSDKEGTSPPVIEDEVPVDTLDSEMAPLPSGQGHQQDIVLPVQTRPLSGKRVDFNLPPVGVDQDKPTDSEAQHFRRDGVEGGDVVVQEEGKEGVQTTAHGTATEESESRSRETIYEMKHVQATSKSSVRLPPLAKSELRKVERQSVPLPDMTFNDRPRDPHVRQEARLSKRMTSDEQLDQLEGRVREFLTRHGSPSESSEFNLPRLRRYHVNIEDGVALTKPGGKVLVRKMICPFANSPFKVTNHEHIRHHMLPEIPPSGIPHLTTSAVISPSPSH
ncbi:unnamed protein product [Lymnaea stagnalis]|uniref:Cyclic nucleotide-binding domain-containing protein n=1 Tax=Lymnaea stagnalis TaxID=6523 RepID=A0AAV2HD74_LYMST